MKKKLINLGVALFALILGLSMVPASATAADYQWPNALTITSPAVGSSVYTLMLAWANKMEQTTGMKVRLLPENSIGAKWVGLKSGRFEMMNESSGILGLFILPAVIGYQTAEGGPFPVRSFWAMEMQSFVVFVRGNSPVKTMRDIPKQGKGFRVAHWTVPGGLEAVQAALAWAGTTSDQVTLVQTGSYPGQIRMVVEGKADMACFAIPTAPVFIEATASPSGVRVLDLNEQEDPEGARAFRTVLPVYSFPEIKSGPEQFRGLHGFGTANMLHVGTDTDPDLIYHMVKWWDQNFDEIKHLHPSIALNMTTEFNYQLFNEMFLPTHEGTIRYFKEKGLWTAANQRRQDYLIKLIDRYTEAYNEARSDAQRKGITVDPGNKDWTALWEQHKKTKQLPAFRILTDAEIETALARLQ